MAPWLPSCPRCTHEDVLPSSPTPREREVTDFAEPEDFDRVELGADADAGRRTARRSGGRPWRPDVGLVVGALGGALAVAGFAWRNARRLGASDATRRRMAWWIVGGVAASLAAAWLTPDRGSVTATAFGYGLRLLERVAGVALAVVLLREQAEADLQHRRAGGDYARALVPGTVAVVVGGAALTGLTLGVVALRLA